MSKNQMPNVALHVYHIQRIVFEPTYETGVGALREKIWQYFEATDYASNAQAVRLLQTLRQWATRRGYSASDFVIAKAEVSRQYKEPRKEL